MTKINSLQELLGFVMSTKDRSDMKHIETASLRDIHDDVNMDLVNAIGTAINDFNDKANLKTMPVLATVAYFLTHEIYIVCANHSEVCAMSTSYGEYIHQMAHSLMKEIGPTEEAKLRFNEEPVAASTEK